VGNLEEKSPIQQRLAIDRWRSIGTFAVVVFSILLLASVWLYIASGFEARILWQTGLNVLLLVNGIGYRRKAAKMTAELEAKYGPQAGVQRRR
jgi:uncharacterized membrane protein